MKKAKIGDQQNNNNSRLVVYLQSRLNDLRNENLSLRERFKSSTTALMDSNTGSDEFGCLTRNHSGLFINTQANIQMENENEPQLLSLRASSIDASDETMFECNDEMLQLKIRDLQKLQMQLNDVKA